MKCRDQQRAKIGKEQGDCESRRTKSLCYEKQPLSYLYHGQVGWLGFWG